jgi:hypothetical protein
LKRSKRSIEETKNLLSAVQLYGTDSWHKISAFVKSRTVKQCRERWIGQLAPSVSRETWSPQEDEVLIRNHAVTGNQWTALCFGFQADRLRKLRIVGIGWLDIVRTWKLAQNREKLILLKKKQCQMVFEPVPLNDGLFGAAFQEFQEKMLMGVWNRKRQGFEKVGSERR